MSLFAYVMSFLNRIFILFLTFLSNEYKEYLLIDVGEKLGFIQTTIEMALQHDGLKNELLSYMEKLLQKEMVNN